MGFKEFINKKEMQDFFDMRTTKHINLVKEYGNKIIDKFPKFEKLKEQLDNHDSSKLNPPEIEPYVYLTWKYKCKAEDKEFDIPKEIEESIHDATMHHVLNNSHHPESHGNRKTNIINRQDRDKPNSTPIDATKMGDLDIAEMIADWSAMSKEKGTNSPKEWADDNINKRWFFNENQTKLIYTLIEAIW